MKIFFHSQNFARTSAILTTENSSSPICTSLPAKSRNLTLSPSDTVMGIISPSLAIFPGSGAGLGRCIVVESDEVASVADRWCNFRGEAHGGGVALASAGLYERIEAI